MAKLTKDKLRQRRKLGIRKKFKANGFHRLCVFKSNKYIYAQVIDDSKGTTVASASSLEADLKSKFKGVLNCDTATQVGKLIAERSQAKGVNNVFFDRNGYLYHGKLKSLATAAREAGLKF